MHTGHGEDTTIGAEAAQFARVRRPRVSQAGAARIAMWSGPRTVSTALMRSWENRPDTVVADEPLYAFYLDRTGLDHPAREQVIASQPTSWQTVIRQLTTESLPAGRTVSYAKHMTHHLLPEVDRDALAPLRHAFLIRDPGELLASYARVRATPTLDDLGLWQQAEIFDRFGGPVVELTGPAGPARGGAAGAVRRARRPVHGGHAVLARGPAGDRRRVGAALVRLGLAVHRIRPLSPAGPGPARPGSPRWPTSASRSTSGCAPAA